MQTQEYTRPQPNVLFGVTHTLDGQPIVRTPRTLKVGIGTPAGKDIFVYISASGEWTVRLSKKNNPFKTRAEAQKFYDTNLKTAGTVQYPSKLPFFVFTRLGASGQFEPAWDAIEKHGPTPTEIDIVFTDDEPLDAAYRMWSAVGLQCFGDGINASRTVGLVKGPEQKKLAEAAAAMGERFFPIVDACHQRGCEYAENVNKNGKISGPLCKPQGTLSFQLLNSPTLGGKASFSTTSYRSIANLFSCLQEFFRITGHGDPRKGFVAGIPLKLVLRPHKVRPEGQAPATAFGVSLEFRAEDVYALHQKLIGAGVKFRETAQLAPPVRRQIAAPVMEDDAVEIPADTPMEDVEDDMPAEAMAQEFYSESFPDETGSQESGPEPDQPATPSEKVEAKTAGKQEDLKEALRQRKARTTAAKAEPAPAQAAAQAAPAQAAAAPEPTAAPEPAADTAPTDEEAFKW